MSGTPPPPVPARPTAEAKAEAWAQVVESEQAPERRAGGGDRRFVQTDQRELLAAYTDKYFEVVKGVWDSRSHEIAQQIAVGLYPALQISEETLRKTDEWLSAGTAERGPAPSGLGVPRGRRAGAAGTGGGRGRGVTARH